MIRVSSGKWFAIIRGAGPAMASSVTDLPADLPAALPADPPAARF
jgi:hypothetical protein